MREWLKPALTSSLLANHGMKWVTSGRCQGRGFLRLFDKPTGTSEEASWKLTESWHHKKHEGNKVEQEAACDTGLQVDVASSYGVTSQKRCCNSWHICSISPPLPRWHPPSIFSFLNAGTAQHDYSSHVTRAPFMCDAAHFYTLWFISVVSRT